MSARKQRAGLAALLDYARQGDVIVVVGTCSKRSASWLPSDALSAGCAQVGNAGEAVDGHEQVQFCEH